VHASRREFELNKREPATEDGRRADNERDEAKGGSRGTFQARGNNAKRRATAGLIKRIVSSVWQRYANTIRRYACIVRALVPRRILRTATPRRPRPAKGVELKGYTYVCVYTHMCMYAYRNGDNSER